MIWRRNVAAVVSSSTGGSGRGSEGQPCAGAMSAYFHLTSQFWRRASSRSPSGSLVTQTGAWAQQRNPAASRFAVARPSLTVAMERGNASSGGGVGGEAAPRRPARRNAGPGPPPTKIGEGLVGVRVALVRPVSENLPP